MSAEVRLIIKAGLGGRQARRHPIEQETPGPVDPAAGQVLMRANPELPAEDPDQVGRVDVQGVGRIPQRNDRDNRAAVRSVNRADLDLVGIAVFGPRGAVDKIAKGAHMHP